MAEAEQTRDEELKSPSYELFIAALSILSIANILFAAIAKDPQVQSVLYYMNGLLSLIFLGDFTMRMLTTHHKSRYFFRQMGWADLLASMPFEAVKIFRVFRLLRAYRLTKRFGLKNMVRELVEDRAGSALLMLLLMGILVLEFGASAMVKVEGASPNANITTGGDALWYTIVTISTVGYGDKYPVTGTGRMIGAVIILVGVGIFGTFTGYLANLFLSPKKKEEVVPAPQPGPMDGPEEKLEELKELLAAQQESQMALQAKLAELEALLSTPVPTP